MTAPVALTEARRRLAFALDYPTLSEARRGAEHVAPQVGVLKVGLELFLREGPAAVRALDDLGCGLFLDLKLHDISKTVERAVANACELGVRYLTLHCSGGPGMLEAAAQRAARENTGLCLLGVTVLTSLDQSDLLAVGVSDSPGQQAERLARLAQQSGLGGLVCSTEEVQRLRRVVGPDLVLVTPGIRPTGGEAGDQKRVGTPAEAIRQGSSLLVVGRPIRDAGDPAAAAASIVQEIVSA
jgi:orotidine-5'-phosphate decarboxylase